MENDTFNAWLVRNLLVWMEEAENANYQSKAIYQRVKQLTTKKASARGMYCETKSARNWAIYGMNTNSKDLYGLIRGEKSVTDRLVILKFKENGNGEVYNYKVLNEKCKSFINTFLNVHLI